MPINKITATKRGKLAIVGVMMTAAAGGYGTWNAQTRTVTTERQQVPVAVVLATEKLIKPWESLVLEAHWDRFAKIYDIGYGDTRLYGRPVRKGDRVTELEADAMLINRAYHDYYLPILNCAPNLKNAPDSVQASMLSGAYNFGVGYRGGKGWCGSAIAKRIDAGEWRAACEVQTAYNRSGGERIEGLVKRREMGDGQRIGEAELCVSGL